MPRRLSPLAVLSTALLSACGARSSLTSTTSDETSCVAWSRRDGRPGAEHFIYAPFDVLDDGSAAVTIEDRVKAAGGSNPTWSTNYLARKVSPPGVSAWEAWAGTEIDSAMILSAARSKADKPLVLVRAAPGTTSVLRAPVPCTGGGYCYYLAELSDAGEVTWTAPLTSGDNVGVNSLRASRDGQITVEGGFEGSVDIGCGPMTGVEGSRFVSRRSPSGECLWAKVVQGTPLLLGQSTLAVNEVGGAVLIMTLANEPGERTVDAGNGPISFSTEHGYGLLVAEYASNGDLLFAKAVGGTGGVTGSASPPDVDAALTNDGDVVIPMLYRGVLDFGGGPRGEPDVPRALVVKLSASGQEVWNHDIADHPPAFDSPSSTLVVAAEPGPSDPAHPASGPKPRPVSGPDGGFVVVGNGQNGMAISGTPTPAGTLFLAVFDAAGKATRVRTFPAIRTVPAGVRTTPDGGWVLAGHFEKTVDFGQLPLTAQGGIDSFVAKVCR